MIAETTVILETSGGAIRGATSGSIHAFKGVPYGAAHRFQAPSPPPPWSGIRDALAFGPASPQNAARVRPAVLQEVLGSGEPLDAGMSENCLVLNVWTAGLGDGGRRPIMVWIHGGGYYAGSGASRQTDGGALARRGNAVVVTVNHRLGVLPHADAPRCKRFRTSLMRGTVVERKIDVPPGGQSTRSWRQARRLVI